MFQAIPLTNDPNQEFQLTLQVDGENVVYKFNVSWNAIGGYWVMTLTDVASGEILLDSIPLVCGGDSSANILQQYDSLQIGTAYLVSLVTEPTSNSPNDTNLGTEFALMWDDNLGYIT